MIERLGFPHPCPLPEGEAVVVSGKEHDFAVGPRLDDRMMRLGSFREGKLLADDRP
jgi:hypothetical protein